MCTKLQRGPQGRCRRALVEAVESVEGALVLGTHVDPDHNRSVITFVAPPEVIVEAAVRVVGRAAELDRPERARGSAPAHGRVRRAAVRPRARRDVEECVALAHEAGRRIWEELGIPVYFYESAATQARAQQPRRRAARRLRAAARGDCDEAERAPDVGEPRVHPTAGACIVGVRPLLIAYNVTLKTRDLSVAKQIARARARARRRAAALEGARLRA
jgi:glutamate formiminotransferase